MKNSKKIYIAAAVYEIMRALVLLSASPGSGFSLNALPPSWFAGAVFLCVFPSVFLRLAFDEKKYGCFLSLTALVKFLGIAALFYYIVLNFGEILILALKTKFRALVTLFLCVFFMVIDGLLGVYCRARNKSLYAAAEGD